MTSRRLESLLLSKIEKYRFYILFKSTLKANLICSCVMFIGLQIYQWGRVFSYKEVVAYDTWFRETDNSCNNPPVTDHDPGSVGWFIASSLFSLFLNLLFIASFFRGYFGIRNEEKLYVYWFLGYSFIFNVTTSYFTWDLCFCDNVSACSCGTSTNHVNLFPMNMFALWGLGALNIFMMVVMYVCAYFCIKNFDQGLKEHLDQINELERKKKNHSETDDFRSKTFEMSRESLEAA